MFRNTLLQIRNTVLVYAMHIMLLEIRAIIYLLQGAVLREMLIPS
jgi:hypothetical protein